MLYTVCLQNVLPKLGIKLNNTTHQHLKLKWDRVKSGNFGHQVDSDIPFANSETLDETAPYEPSHQDFHCLLSLFILLFQ